MVVYLPVKVWAFQVEWPERGARSLPAAVVAIRSFPASDPKGSGRAGEALRAGPCRLIGVAGVILAGAAPQV
jgi:hypothetical protein